MIFLYTNEVKDACKELDAALARFEEATEKQRLADVHLHKLTMRMQHAYEEAVNLLRRG